MAFNLNSLLGWFGFGGTATGQRSGIQSGVPSASLVTDSPVVAPDAALQLDTVWACIDRRATIIASLPMHVYNETDGGQKTLARTSRLYGLLHDSPNARMTPTDFWRVIMMNYDLRGNGYARIERDERTGEALALWPMAADQVQPIVLQDGTMVYTYRIDNDVMVLAEENVFHLRNLGNGTVGMDKLSFMRAGINEAASQVRTASTVWGTSGKPTGVLMVDHVLKPDQRTALMDRFAGMAHGSASRLYLLEAAMKYQQISITPEQQQLLESRQFSVEQICRWFDVPPVLVHHANVSTWPSAMEQIVEGFHKFTIRPLAEAIEQTIAKRVMTARQRASMEAEFSMDALLRGAAKDRAEIYAKQVQNGIMTRNEVRQLENLPPMAGADQLTAQTNTTPVHLLGQAPQANQGAANAAA